jgi:hypothetical protein
MPHIEGWRKYSVVLLVVAGIALLDAFRRPLSSGTLNTVENITIAYLAGQSAIDIIAARAKAQSAAKS